MIVCPNCLHSNPEGADQCEACYTPLVVMQDCPNCGSPTQAEANFCGQCGFNLKQKAPVYAPQPVYAQSIGVQEPLLTPETAGKFNDRVAAISTSEPVLTDAHIEPRLTVEPPAPLPVASPPLPSPPPTAPVAPPPPPSFPRYQGPITSGGNPKTQLQQSTARLLHVQTNTPLELPLSLSVVHVGKPNDRIPPDLDVSGLPHSEVVSRIHADIRVEGDAFYIEDVGSANGTYVNSLPLPPGNRHRMRPGDRIALGKGDLVSFLFQIN